MLNKVIIFFRKIFYLFKKKFVLRAKHTIKDSEISANQINHKIKVELKINRNFIELERYENFFNFLQHLGLWRNFIILTSYDNLMLSGSHFRPLIINKNNDKLIIFCHGVTSNRWSLFYCVHLVLQLGYQVIIYDARGHGYSGRKKTSLGRLESRDLEDIIHWANKNCRISQIGLYGFSMGASTCLFWLSSFQEKHPEIKFIICESPFDELSKQFQHASGATNPNSWRYLISLKFLRYLIPTEDRLMEIAPISSLPNSLSIKLLLLHGTEDATISWKATENIWKKCRQNPLNKKYVNAYFFLEADHGELPFIGDALIGKLRWIQNRQRSSQFQTFTELLTAFLKKNF